MSENIDLQSLDMNTILSYARKYLELKAENNRRQKKYYSKDNKKDVIRKKAKIAYYIKKDIYHPEYNPDCMNEGRKFKRPSDDN